MKFLINNQLPVVLATRSIFLFLFLFAASLTKAGETVPQAFGDMVEGSYILVFQDPAAGETPIVEGKTKEELEQILGTNGQIVRIFTNINGIHILMDTQEADRLRQNPHVSDIEQDRVVGIDSILANPTEISFPSYRDGLLTILQAQVSWVADSTVRWPGPLPRN